MRHAICRLRVPCVAPVLKFCPVRIPITEQMQRLRVEAQRSPTEAVPHPIRGQGASHTFGEQMAWRTFDGIFSGSKAYRAFGWTASKFRALTPRKTAGLDG